MTDAEPDRVREQASADYRRVCQEASRKKSLTRLIERLTYDGIDIAAHVARYQRVPDDPEAKRAPDDPEAKRAPLQRDFKARQQGSADTRQAELDRAWARAETEYERVKAEALAEYKRLTGEEHPDRS